MAEINDELEICQSLENVNCTNETPHEPETTNEIIPPTEPTTTDQPIISTNTMD